MLKKGATSLSILLLVLLTLALVLFSLFTFLTKKAGDNNFLYQSLEDLYIKETEINFYISQGGVIEDVPKLMGIRDGKIIFDDKTRDVIITKSYYKDAEKKIKIIEVAYRFKPKEKV